MWAKVAQSEFFVIKTDANKQLNCAPFGVTSVKSPSAPIPAYNETIRKQYGWMHIVCQYTYMRNVTTYAYATTAGGATLDTSQSISLSSNPSYIPADTYTIFMGNSYMMNSGPGLLQMKEVRMWSMPRTYDDIALWRYRQVKSQ